MINGKIVLPSKYLYIYNKIGFVLTCNEGKKGESIKALEVLARQRCLRSLRELNPLTFPYAVIHSISLPNLFFLNPYSPFVFLSSF